MPGSYLVVYLIGMVAGAVLPLTPEGWNSTLWEFGTGATCMMTACLYVIVWGERR